MTNRGNFIWYELMTSDAQAAESFYSQRGWLGCTQDSGVSEHEIYLADGR